MKQEEKDLLKKLVDSPEGMLVDYIFAVGSNRKLVQKLISVRLIESFQLKGQTFYRATESGYSIFYPLPQKLWYWFKRDIRTIIVAIIISIITTLLTLLVKEIS